MSDDLLGSFFSDIAAVEEDVVPSAKKARTSVQGADAATIGGTIAGAPTHTVTVMAVTALAPPALQAAATSTVFSAAPSAAPVSSNFDHYSSSSYSSSSSSSAAPPSSSSSSSQDKAKVGGADLMSFLMSKVKPQVNSSGHAPAWAPTPDPRGMGGADTFTGAGGAGTGTAGMEGVKTSDRDKVFVRKAAGETWVDDSLRDWPENDFRLFIGDLSKDVKEKALEEAFQHYKTYTMCRIAMSKFGGRGEPISKGYGFVSFLDPMDAAKAMREKQGKYLGPRPMKISRADWMKRDAKEIKKKAHKDERMRSSLGL